MSYIDWIQHLGFIDNPQDKTILELGCGRGTKTLCDTFKYVYSFETWHNDEWYEYTLRELQDKKNWSSYYKDFSYYGLSGDAIRPQTKAFEKYNKELEQWVDLSTVDVAFVDQGFYLRGESVNYFMSRNIPIIFAHDTNKIPHKYGWDVINPTKYGYTVSKKKEGQGVTFFTK